MNPNALQKISYGMYTLTSGKDGKLKGQIVNAVVQATADPVTTLDRTKRPEWNE